MGPGEATPGVKEPRGPNIGEELLLRRKSMEGDASADGGKTMECR